MSKLACQGGTPVREVLLPYGRQWIDEDDVAAVAEALRSEWLTTGPRVTEFEGAFADATGTGHAISSTSGTAALHMAAAAADVGPGDEVIVPPMTFAATANCVVFEGGTPVFADVEKDTLLLDPRSVAEKITERTKAVIAVDFAGHPCDYDALREVLDGTGIVLVADACHSVGGAYRGRPVGSLADLSVFSLHPVKNLTAGEGGVTTTDNPEWAAKMRRFRAHGIGVDFRERAESGSWIYDMVELGYCYRLNDIQCALGRSQLAKLPGWVRRRQEIAGLYDRLLRSMPGFAPLVVHPDVSHGYHLYVIRLDPERFSVPREEIFGALRAEGIGVNVHYRPVHYHPFYRDRFGTGEGLCPVAEAEYERLLTLPLFPQMTDRDVHDVVDALGKVAEAWGRSGG